MLGHVFSDYFQNKFQLHGTLKNSLKTYKGLGSSKINYFDNVDVLKEYPLEKVMNDCNPHFIITCWNLLHSRSINHYICPLHR